MTAEVQYVLNRLEQVVDNQPNDHPLELINRDESDNVTEELKRANYALVNFDSDDPSVRGNEYHLDNVVTVQVRVVGMQRGDNFGHVDPAGENGVPWRDTYDASNDVDQQGLLSQITERLYDDRTYPDVPGEDVYKHILPIQENDLSSDWGDEYRTILTVPFEKIEEP